MEYEGSNLGNAQIIAVEETLGHHSINEDDLRIVPFDSSTRQRSIKRPCCCSYCTSGNERYRNGQMIHLCPYAGCGRIFSKSCQVYSHLACHTGEKPYVCSFEQCGKKFKRSHDLSRHERIHTNKIKFFCQYCKKSFSRSDNLSYHMKSHFKQIKAN